MGFRVITVVKKGKEQLFGYPEAEKAASGCPIDK